MNFTFYFYFYLYQLWINQLPLIFDFIPITLKSSPLKPIIFIVIPFIIFLYIFYSYFINTTKIDLLYKIWWSLKRTIYSLFLNSISTDWYFIHNSISYNYTLKKNYIHNYNSVTQMISWLHNFYSNRVRPIPKRYVLWTYDRKDTKSPKTIHNTKTTKTYINPLYFTNIFMHILNYK